jgi:hypothetical protein
MKKYYISDRILFFLKNNGIPPLFASCLFGFLFFIIYCIIRFLLCQSNISWQFSVCITWLFIGPYLIYQATPLWEKFKTKLKDIVNESEYENLVKHIESFFWSKKHWLGSGLAILAILIYIAFEYIGKIPSLHPCSSGKINYYFFSYYIFVWLILAYLGGIGVWGVVSMHELFKKLKNLSSTSVKIDQYDINQIGGLKFLSNFVTTAILYYFTGSLMLPWAVYTLTATGNNYLRLLGVAIPIIHFTIILLGFLLPVYYIHILLVKKKNSLVDSSLSQINNLSNSDKEKSISAIFSYLINKNELDFIMQIKTWPWNFSLIVSFLLSIISIASTFFVALIPNSKIDNLIKLILNWILTK